MFYYNFPQRKIKVLLFQHFYGAVQQLSICISWLWYWWWFFSAVVGYALFLLQMVFSQVCKIGWEADILLWLDSYPNTNHDSLTFSIIKYQRPIGFVCGVGFLVVLYFILFFFNYIIKQVKLPLIWGKEKEKNRNYVPRLQLGPPCHALLRVRNENSHCLNILSITVVQMEGIKSQHHSSSRHPTTGVNHTLRQGKVNNLLRLNINPIITLRDLNRTTDKIPEISRVRLAFSLLSLSPWSLNISSVFLFLPSRI